MFYFYFIFLFIIDIFYSIYCSYHYTKKSPQKSDYLRGQAPSCVYLIADSGRPQLRSAHTNVLTVPKTNIRLGDRSFSVAGPRIWNSLPASLREPDIEFRHFKRFLKAFLFGETERRSSDIRFQCAVHKSTYLLTYYNAVLKRSRPTKSARNWTKVHLLLFHLLSFVTSGYVFFSLHPLGYMALSTHKLIHHNVQHRRGQLCFCCTSALAILNFKSTG